MSPAIGLCCMCSIGVPPTKNFRLGHCFGPASLLGLLHNPKCTESSLSLNSQSHIYWSGKGVLIISFSSEQLSRFTPSQKVVLTGRPAKIPIFRPPSLAHMWLTPTLVVVLIY